MFLHFSFFYLILHFVCSFAFQVFIGCSILTCACVADTKLSFNIFAVRTFDSWETFASFIFLFKLFGCAIM